MRKLIVALAAAVCGICSVRSETVARALVTAYHGNVYLYNIDENGAWTRGSTLVSASPATVRSPFHSIFRNGIVYVTNQPDEMSSPTSTGYVYKVKLDGTIIGKIALPGCYPEGMAITPDGKTMFVSDLKCDSDGDGTSDCCRVYKIDLATEGMTVFAKADGGNLMFRDMCVDGSGHLYCAARDGNALFVYDYLNSTPDPVTGLVAPVTTVALNFAEGVAWDPVRDEIHVAGKEKLFAIYRWNGDSFEAVQPLMAATGGDATGWCVSLNYVDGTLYGASYNNAIVRFNYDTETPANSTFTKVVSDPLSRFGGVAPIDPNEYAAARWRLDEEAYASICPRSDGVCSLWPQAWAIPGADGVRGKCLYFAGAKASAKFDRSSKMIPAKDDFCLSFWVGLPAGGSGERLLFSNRNSLATDEFSILIDAYGHLGLRFVSSGTCDVTTDSDIADGAWHQVAVVRRGKTSLELYCDGVKVATGTVDANAAIGQTRDWHLGCNSFEDEGFLGIGAFFDEIAYYTGVDIPKEFEFRQLYAAGKDAAAPTGAPTAPAAAAMPAACGTEITQSFPCTGSIGAPSIIVAANGDYYVAVGIGEAANRPQLTTIYRSTDKGGTWAALPLALAASGVSIFETSGRLCAIGMPQDGAAEANARTFCVWAYDETDGWVEKSRHVEAAGRYSLLASNATLYPDRAEVWKAAVRRSAINQWDALNLYFTFNADAFAFGAINGKNGVFCGDSSYLAYNTAENVLGGVSVPRLGLSVGGIHSFWPVVDTRGIATGASNIPLGLERCAQDRCLWGTAAYEDYALDMFRGGSKPFGLVYDSAAKRYLAVTIPVTNHLQLADAQSTADLNNLLAVYSSTNLQAWAPCGAISDIAGSGGYTAANCAIDGNDLVIAVSVAVPDGANRRASYLAFRRVANFRETFVPEAPATKERLIVTDREGTALFYSYFRTADGEWQPAGRVFEDARVPRGNVTYKPLQNVFCRNGRYFAGSCENVKPAFIYELTRKGKVRHRYDSPAGIDILNFDVSPDGTWAAIASNSGAGIYRVNFADNTWTKVISNGDEHIIGSVRSVQIGPEGDIFTGIWSSTVIGHYKLQSDGTYDWDQNLTQQQGSNSFVTGLVFDPSDGSLYSSDIRGKVFKSPATAETMPALSSVEYIRYHTAANCLGLVPPDGKVYATSRGGMIRAIDTTTGEITCPLAFLSSSCGVCYVEDAENQPGFLLFMR